ncbi:MAG TPA: hypothetical protein VEH31_35715 [Streptosporangiaceae bacterium]|nr:hypothetical protein [Streptosporangiaceae bacterium]
MTRAEVDGFADGVDGECRHGGCCGHPGNARPLLPAGQQCRPGGAAGHRHLGAEQEPGERAEPGGRSGQRHLGIPGE